MKLSEFSPGTEIVITSFHNEIGKEFVSKIIHVGPNEVYAEPIIVDEKPVHFMNPNKKRTVSVNEKTKVYVYEDVVINEVKSLSHKLKYVIQIKSEADVQAVNRRNFFRVFLGIDGKLQAGTRQKEYEVIVKDISANGIGVVCSKERQFRLGTEVCITFLDELTDESFEVKCTIVRRVDHDEEHYIYGCKLPTVDEDMEKFVALRQRLALAYEHDK